jgi:inhibitor of cysteine peptidase
VNETYKEFTEGYQMKSVVFFGLVYLLLLPLLAIGCDKTGQIDQKIVLFTLDDFMAENNIIKNVELNARDILTVRLDANHSTGYTWQEAEISNTSLIKQNERYFIEPTDTKVVGAPGTDVWVFDSLKAGSATISFSYDRPWEGGEKGTYTLTINVTVK